MENVNSKSDVEYSVSDKRETFEVKGMTCASCASTVQKMISSLEGVKSVEVDLAGSSATVVYDPAVANSDKMQKAVETVGYQFLT